jgi:tRNA ligase
MREAQGNTRKNHLRKHREDLRDASTAMHPLSTCSRAARTNRSLHGDADAKSHEDVLWQFLRNTEPLDDDEADEAIEMDISEDLARAIYVVMRVPRPAPPRPETRRRSRLPRRS